jgi:hypothetical protein
MRSMRTRTCRALAFLAAVASAFAPTLGYAHPAFAGSGSDAEICTAAGVARVPVEDGGPAPASRVEHCALCIAPSGAFAPGAPPSALAALGRGEAPVATGPAVPAPVERVRAARPRGPPAPAGVPI